MKVLHMITFTLLVIGGLNWLAVGFGYNVVDMIFGIGSSLSRVIYVLVGLSAIVEIFTHKANCMCCMGMKKDGMKSM